jgi:hypothetical protein
MVANEAGTLIFDRLGRYPQQYIEANLPIPLTEGSLVSNPTGQPSAIYYKGDLDWNELNPARTVDLLLALRAVSWSIIFSIHY